MEFSMLLPNQTVKTRRPIMSAKSNTNLKAVELTQSELDSVTGGIISEYFGLIWLLRRHAR
jgi:hypothetical protein